MMELAQLTQDILGGFWKYYCCSRNLGEKINHKRLHRIYKESFPFAVRRRNGFRKGYGLFGGAPNVHPHLEYRLYEGCIDQRKKVPQF